MRSFSGESSHRPEVCQFVDASGRSLKPYRCDVGTPIHHEGTEGGRVIFLEPLNQAIRRVGRILKANEKDKINLELQTTSFLWLFQLDDEPNHYIKNGWKSPNIH